MKKKLLSLSEAVTHFIPSGSQIALGGFTVNRNPMALVREIIRQGISGLHVVAHSQGQALDLLIGAGSVSLLEIAYGGNGRFAPTCIRFRKAVENHELLVEDYSNYQMSLRFLAGALNLPFIPAKSGLATDLIKREGFSSDIRTNTKAASQKFVLTHDPFSPNGDPVLLLPALNPDVALLHAQYVGDDGAVRIKGLTFADIEQAKSARAVIVSFEELVPGHELRQDPDQNALPPFMVDAYVQAPWGAHPTACHFFYDYDPHHLKAYGQAAKNDSAFKEYLDEWVWSLPTENAYIEKIGPETRKLLTADPQTGYAIGLDRR